MRLISTGRTCSQRPVNVGVTEHRGNSCHHSELKFRKGLHGPQSAVNDLQKALNVFVLRCGSFHLRAMQTSVKFPKSGLEIRSLSWSTSSSKVPQMNLSIYQNKTDITNITKYYLHELLYKNTNSFFKVTKHFRVS